MKIVAANWKMNKTLDEARCFIDNYIKRNKNTNVKVIIAAPYTHLHDLTSLSNGFSVAAQNCHHKSSGAFTGEVSAKMLSSIGVKYVIVGHSERRIYNNESDEIIKQKLRQLYDNNLTPIFCCGEQKSERENNKQFDCIKEQINVLLSFNKEKIKNTIIAYEPVWAIGTGQTASSDQAEEMHAYIRTLLEEEIGNDSDSVSIIYGGSCNVTTASMLFSQPNINGGLIGTASLDFLDFIQIVNS